MRISAVMPAYNEAHNIEQTVRHCFETLEALTDDVEIVVTNDGSRDETADVLRSLQDEFRNLIVETNNPNQGYGAALARAISVSTGDIIVTIDSDGQFDIADVRRMLPLFNGQVDVLTGFREVKRDSFIKVAGDRIMNRMIRWMFHVKYRDTNCALKLMKGSMARSMILEAKGFQLPTEIVLKAHALGMSVMETAVGHSPRKRGQSSLAPLKTAWQMLVFLFYLRRKITLYKKGVLRSL